LNADSQGDPAGPHLRLSQAQENDISQIRPREPREAATTESVQSARILVVDDIEGNRDLLSRRLRRKGYETESAVDGKHAIEMLGSRTFDLVMLDIMMPGIDGFEVLRWIRHRWSSIELPVIMQSARDERESMVDAFALGANDYVTKPIDFAVAEARVRTHLQLKRAQRCNDVTTSFGTSSVAM
jgi:DNA-binding response OmpR family regulator